MVLGMFRAHNRSRVHVAGYHYGPEPDDVAHLIQAHTATQSSPLPPWAVACDVAAAARRASGVDGGAVVTTPPRQGPCVGVGNAGNGSVTMQLACSSDQFYSVGRATDDGIGGQMAAEGVDIVVDLMVLTRSARVHITALRPAPIMVSYLGYPRTSGREDVVAGGQCPPPFSSSIPLSCSLSSLCHPTLMAPPQLYPALDLATSLPSHIPVHLHPTPMLSPPPLYAQPLFLLPPPSLSLLQACPPSTTPS